MLCYKVIPPYLYTKPMSGAQLTGQLATVLRYSSRTSDGDLLSFAVSRAGEERLVYKLVRTSRLYEQIVQQIEESIVKGDLKPGDQLPTAWISLVLAKESTSARMSSSRSKCSVRRPSVLLESVVAMILSNSRAQSRASTAQTFK